MPFSARGPGVDDVVGERAQVLVGRHERDQLERHPAALEGPAHAVAHRRREHDGVARQQGGGRLEHRLGPRRRPAAADPDRPPRRRHEQRAAPGAQSRDAPEPAVAQRARAVLGEVVQAADRRQQLGEHRLRARLADRVGQEPRPDPRARRGSPSRCAAGSAPALRWGSRAQSGCGVIAAHDVRPARLPDRVEPGLGLGLALVREVEAQVLEPLGQVLLVVDVAGVVVRVVVALAAAELARGRVGGRAQRRRGGLGAVLADVAADLADRALDGVGLGRHRQVDRRLVDREFGLRAAHCSAAWPAATAITSACGLALPMSSEASTIIRRAMKRGSSPPTIIVASQYRDASGSEPRVDLIQAEM